MPELISATLTFGLVALRAASQRSSGVSKEAINVFSRVEEVCSQVDVSSFSYLGKRNSVVSELNERVVEHLNSAWSGDEIAPVSWVSYRNAREFLAILPASVPNPEVAIEPDDGAISLEWHVGYRKLFAMSVGVGTRFAFVGLYGNDKIYGVLDFDKLPREAPEIVVSSIKRLSK